MRKNDFLFTSESVTEGHPDKIADQISDSVLDFILRYDLETSRARVACETLVDVDQKGNSRVVVGGEITTTTQINENLDTIVKRIVKDIGYVDPKMGFDYHLLIVDSTITTQSPDISQGVNKGGAGDQGMMFGHATNETQEYMPLPIVLAHNLARRLAEVRKSGEIPDLWPDGKTQVTVEYANRKPRRVHTVVIAAQNNWYSDSTQENRKLVSKFKSLIKDKVITPVCGEYIDDKTIYHINSTGKFREGGPKADAGLTGRKIIVDTYGGWVPHGGGCFSGKDPSKVDRSANYAARYVAKNIVAAGLADECVIQLAYTIGIAEPVSININTGGTGKISDGRILGLVQKYFDLTPNGIIEQLHLVSPIYQKTAAYGHFGRNDTDFSWEKTDKADLLRTKTGL